MKSNTTTASPIPTRKLRAQVQALMVGGAMLAGVSTLAGGVAYDVPTVNGHPGYRTAYQVSPDGIVDKVMMVVSGYDTDNTSDPLVELDTDPRW